MKHLAIITKRVLWSSSLALTLFLALSLVHDFSFSGVAFCLLLLITLWAHKDF